MAGSALPPSIHVIETVAETDGIDPLELEPPLNRVIDTDALDAIFSRADGGCSPSPRVSFDYRGYEVVVEGPDEVRVQRTPPEPETDRGPTEPTTVD